MSTKTARETTIVNIYHENADDYPNNTREEVLVRYRKVTLV